MARVLRIPTGVQRSPKSRRAIGGERQDGERIFREHVLPLEQELMRRVMRITGGDRADAEDLVQETLLKSMTAIASLEDPARVRSWVHTIMHNTFASLCRRNARRPLVSVDPSDMEAFESPRAEPRADIRFDIERAMAGLDDSFRDAVECCDVQGLSYAEAAEVIGCPQGTLMSRLHRGRKRLQIALA